MGISFGGINTGLPPNIVEMLMEAEKIPIKNMESKKGKSEARLKLVEDLESKVSAIQGSIGNLASVRGFTDIKLNSGDPNVISGSVDPGAAVTGSWNVEVMELAQRASGVTNGFPDRDKTEIGVGYFRFKTPDGNKDVYIKGDNSTLDGAAKAINAANVGVRASVIRDGKDKDAPYRLMISGANVGDDKNIEYPTLYFLDGDQDVYFEEKREAKNGKVKIDGYEMDIMENTLKDVIPGVTLEIKQANPGRTVNLSVKEDFEVVSGKVDKFVSAMNDVLNFLQAQSKLTKDTDTTKTLGGDSLIRSVEGRFRQLIQNQQFGVGEIKTLAQMGIQFNRNGTLNFDQDKFNATLRAKPDDVQKFFAGDGFSVGFIPTLRREVSTLLSPNTGYLATRKSGLKNQIDQQDQRIATKERMLVQKEQSLRRQFSNLEEKMSKIKAQGAAVGSMTAQQNLTMSGGGSGSGGNGSGGGSGGSGGGGGAAGG